VGRGANTPPNSFSNKLLVNGGIMTFKKCFKCGGKELAGFGQKKAIGTFNWFTSIFDILNQIDGLKVDREKKVFICEDCLTAHYRNPRHWIKELYS